MAKKNQSKKAQVSKKQAPTFPSYAAEDLFIGSSWEFNEAKTFQMLKGGLNLIQGFTQHAENGIDDEERYIITNFCDVMIPRLDQLEELQFDNQLLFNLGSKRFDKHFDEMREAARQAAIQVDKKYRPERYR